MIPPLMSSTLNAQDVLGGGNKEGNGKTQSNTGASTKTQVVKTEEKSAGRPEKSDDQKSAKTIANKESMS